MKRRSIYDVAKNINVSASTVSRVLNNDSRISEKTRKKVMDELKRIKYIPNQYAKYLKNKENKNIGVFYEHTIHEKITPYLMNEKICGICEECGKSGYNVSLFFGEYKDQDIWNIVMENNLCGILSIDRFYIDISKKINEYSIPHVQVNWDNEALEESSYITVEIDMKKAMRMMLDHLYSRGYRQIEVLNYFGVTSHTSRLNHAIDEFLTDHHDVEVTKVEIEIEPRHVDYPLKKKELYEHLDKGIKRAYLCNYYQQGFWIIDYAKEHGLSIPEDLAVMILDYNDVFSLYHPTPSGIIQPFFEIGALAVRKLISVIEGNEEKSEYVEPILYIGETT